MSISILSFKQILNYYLQGIFTNINSVLDMGDQDLSVPFDLLSELIKQAGLEFDEKIFERAKDFPARPRVSSSSLWKTLGIKITDRVDITSIERIDSIDQNSVIQLDLNYPLEDKNLWNKYDLVTDFGNNEHPFNIMEAYRTMHRLTNLNGYLWISQELYGGNGFYNLDRPFFENMAAANDYSIYNASYIVNVSSDDAYLIPCEENLLSMIDFGKVLRIGINYLFRKNSLNDFAIPYQGSANQKARELTNYFHSNITVHDQSLLVRNYIPNSISDISGRTLFSELVKRFKKKIPIFK